jgi:hypothetical protein
MFEDQLKLLPWLHDQELIEPTNGDASFIINN